MTLTSEEVKRELDAEARHMLGLDADEFLARYRAGELDLESPAVLRLTVLARLLNQAKLRNGHNGHRA